MPMLKTPPGMIAMPAGTRRAFCDFPASIAVTEANNTNAATLANMNEIRLRIFCTIF
jgi:hypothetical protein